MNDVVLGASVAIVSIRLGIFLTKVQTREVHFGTRKQKPIHWISLAWFDILYP